MRNNRESPAREGSVDKLHDPTADRLPPASHMLKAENFVSEPEMSAQGQECT